MPRSKTLTATKETKLATAFPEKDWLRALKTGLLKWYGRNARTLPWRGTHDPYRVWVSEIMLQQTQVETVKAYFVRFIDAFPNLAMLAKSPEEKVLRLWEGLGYYRRARQLHRAAQQIVAEHDGVFPHDLEAVRQLPGIGRYTAGAILSISFDARQPILEANTVRLFSRLLAFRGNSHSAAGQKTLWHFATEILPTKNTGTFNQALMELGSLICTPREPKCTACPLFDLCPTRRSNLQDKIPVAKKKPVFESVRETAFVIERRGEIALRQCRAGERWAGLWDFPRFACDPADSTANAKRLHQLTGLKVTPQEVFAKFQHGVTRFRISLSCQRCNVVSGRLQKTGEVLRWVSLAELSNYPLNTTARKLAKLLASQ